MSDWSFLGSVSSEERGLAVWELLHERRAVGFEQLLVVSPPENHPQVDAMRAAISAERERFLRLGGSAESLVDYRLFARPAELFEFVGAFSVSCSSSVILDITSLPKRFFFPLVRFLTDVEEVEDIVVTYTRPASYGEPPLHEDVSEPSYVPTFMSSTGDEIAQGGNVLAVAVGFESPGLIRVLEEDQGEAVHFMFPFPAPPPYFGGTWEFLQEGLSATDAKRTTVLGVSSVDPWSAFDRVSALTEGGRRPSVLAPYGPKSVSLAMCLFCLGPGRDSSSVRYSQPQFYSPFYSSGVARDRHGVVSFAYPIRLRGRNFY